jgi:hypothetical protein
MLRKYFIYPVSEFTMVKLTEDVVVAHTRVSDMNYVKKLNCWGAELSDISVLRKLKRCGGFVIKVSHLYCFFLLS